MPIKEIELVSFRNHDTLKLKFCPNINVIWGRNGSGKTSVLEALHLLSIGKSFRTSRKKELLKEKADFFRIDGKFQKKEEVQTVQLNQTKDGNRRIFIDGVKMESVKELVGLNPVVLLSPEEQIITKGAPLNQRNYFNKLFSVVSIKFFSILSDYSQILKQRNKLLDNFHMMSAENDELDIWNEKISEIGQKLWMNRKELFYDYCVELEQVVKDFNDNEIKFYAELSVNIPENESEYSDKLRAQQNKDIFLGRTIFGPHTDKVNFNFGGTNLKTFGSQGEHKLSLLLIKLAELRLIKNKTQKEPVVLLDDLFAKLDDNRSKQAMSMIDKNLQTIITTTDLTIVEKRGIKIDNINNCSFYLA